jgi:hypothetical protein
MDKIPSCLPPPVPPSDIDTILAADFHAAQEAEDKAWANAQQRWASKDARLKTLFEQHRRDYDTTYALLVQGALNAHAEERHMDIVVARAEPYCHLSVSKYTHLAIERFLTELSAKGYEGSAEIDQRQDTDDACYRVYCVMADFTPKK